MITLKQLRYFESLSRHLHFGRAAEESAVTQPALSQQLQDLEAQLGTQLVERGKGGICLTDPGHEARHRNRCARNVYDRLAAPWQIGFSQEGRRENSDCIRFRS